MTATPTSTSSETFASLSDYLATFALEMSGRIEHAYRPLYDPELDPLSNAVLACSTEEMAPFPPQAAVVEAGVRYLTGGGRDLTISGEMGCGKTPVGCWIAKALELSITKPIRVVVTCPNHLVYKWRSHFERILPNAQTTIITNYKQMLPLINLRRTVRKVVTHRDAQGNVVGTSESLVHRWAKPLQTEVYIIPRDKGKLGYAWRAAPLVRERRALVLECPKCGRSMFNAKGLQITPSDFVTPAGNLRAKRTCHNVLKAEDAPRKNGLPRKNGTRRGDDVVCGEPLWQAHNGLAGPYTYEGFPVPGVSPQRVAPCELLRRMGFKFDLYIADEAHELKGGGSLQGQMFADLCGLSRWIVPMTGTLVGGYAENLEHILWRTNAGDMVRDGQSYTETGHEGFVRTYGVLKLTKKYKPGEEEDDKTKDLTLGRGKVMSSRVKSLPGINPILFSNLLCGKTVFLRLADMHAHLPKFNERVHAVPMDASDEVHYRKMQADYDSFRAKRSSVGASGGASAFGARAVFLRWPDKPWVDPYWVLAYQEDGTPIKAFEVPSLPQRERPKERRIRRLIQRNLLRGRKTWVFSELSGMDGIPAWDWAGWFAQYLNRYGIRTAVMRSTAGGGPKPEDREAWVAKMSPEVDVVISNPGLVKTGIDLYAFPSLIFAYTGDNLYTLRQASRRAWRLGQTEECEVDYLVYRCKGGAKSIQEAAMTLMAKKMTASLAIEGDFSADGLAAMVGGGDDVATQLARVIDGSLQLESVEDAFAAYRKKFDVLGATMGTALPRLRGQSAPVAAPAEPLLFPTTRPADEPFVPPAEKWAEPSPLVGVPARTAPVVPDIPEAPQVQPVALTKAVAVAAKNNKRSERLAALCATLGRSAEQRDGDWFLIGDCWYALVLRRPTSGTDANACAFAACHPDGFLAYAEPVDEAGPIVRPAHVEVGGVRYQVAFLPIAKYLDGGRVPGPK